MMMVVLMMVMGRSFDELTLDRSWSMLRLMMMMKPSWSWSWLSGLMTDMDDEFLLVLLVGGGRPDCNGSMALDLVVTTI